MNLSLETVIESHPQEVLHVLIKSPWVEQLKVYDGFDSECIPYQMPKQPSGDITDYESLASAYFVPVPFLYGINFEPLGVNIYKKR